MINATQVMIPNVYSVDEELWMVMPGSERSMLGITFGYKMANRAKTARTGVMLVARNAYPARPARLAASAANHVTAARSTGIQVQAFVL